MRPWIIFLIFLCAPSRLFSQYQRPSVPPAEAKGLASLTSLVQEATERNPEIQAARRAVQAKRARVPQAGAWPDPKLSVSYGGNVLPPFTLMAGDPSSARQIMAEQEIPYPGKTRLRTEIASRDADAEALAYEAVRRRIAAEVKQAYFDLWLTDQSLSTLRKDRELLEKFEKIAEIRYSVGKAAQQDVLKAQVELTRLLERQTVLEQSRQTFQAQLNSLRNLPPDVPIGTPDDFEVGNLAASLDELQAAATGELPGFETAADDGGREPPLSGSGEKGGSSGLQRRLHLHATRPPAGYVRHHAFDFTAHLPPQKAGHGHRRSGGESGLFPADGSQ